MAPFRMDCSRSATAFSAQPGPPAPFHATLANTRKRSGWPLARMKSTFCFTESGLLPPLRLTSTRRFSWSISAISWSMFEAFTVVWLWLSMTGNFAFGTGCAGTTRVVRGR